MRPSQLCVLLTVLVLALAGCGRESKSTLVVEPDNQAREPANAAPSTDETVSEPENQTAGSVQNPIAGNSKTETEQQTGLAHDEKQKPVDVREVGPPDPPQNPLPPQPESDDRPAAQEGTDANAVTAPPAAPVESPLRDIRPPDEEKPKPEYVEKQTIEIPKNWTRITPVGESEVWIDVKAKHVMVAGVVCLDRGGLEMFICPLNTKEHESVIAVNSASYQIHAALLGIGITPGQPVQWHPEYKAAQGPVIEIDVMWKDPDGEKIRVTKAQNMIRNFQTKKVLDLDWVFGGSVLETDKESGQSYYYADGGEMVCLSNFSTAMLDLPIESSDSNNDLLYEANPEAIPEPGTKVYVIFKPKVEKPSESKDQ